MKPTEGNRMVNQETLELVYESLRNLEQRANLLRQQGEIIGLDARQEQMLAEIESSLARCHTVIEHLREGNREAARQALKS